jgi:hypothetical protein
MDQLMRDLLPTGLAHVLPQSEPGIEFLTSAAHSEGAGMLVVGASEELLKHESLQSLRKHLRCPICLVTRWDAGNSAG